MIVLNEDRFFSGGRWGVIQTPSFRCALNTVHIGGKGSFAVIASFAGEWDYKNYEPVAEALLKASLSRNQVIQLHDRFVEQLDRRGMEGVDLGGAIEEVFGDAYDSGLVARYENNAPLLLKRQA